MLLYILLFSSLTLQLTATLILPVDLGYKFDENTLYWFGSSNFNLTPTFRQETPFWYATNSFAAAEHGGTHLDAPYHFNKEGWKVGDIPLERLLVEGVVIDLKSEAANDHDFEVTEKHLVEWEQIHGKLPDNVVVLVNFGWAFKYSNRTAYFGGSNASELHFPGISKDAAIWMVNSGKVVGVGVDTPSIDPGVNTEFIAHQILNKANIYLLENVALSNVSLPARNIKLIVMPMKITEGTGSPLRLIAYPLEDKWYSKVTSWAYSMLDKFRGMFRAIFN